MSVLKWVEEIPSPSYGARGVNLPLIEDLAKAWETGVRDWAVVLEETESESTPYAEIQGRAASLSQTLVSTGHTHGYRVQAKRRTIRDENKVRTICVYARAWRRGKGEDVEGAEDAESSESTDQEGDSE